MFDDRLLAEIREKFMHVDSCPWQGARVFFENAGGSLTLKQVVEVNSRLAGIPDNQGRDNPASLELVRIIAQARQDMMRFLGASDGLVFIGESGTELLFRLVRAAVLGTDPGGEVLGSTLEHPSTASAARRWAETTGKKYRAVPHDPHTATVTADDYRPYISAETRVATIIQNSPVSGMEVDIKAVVEAIRSVSPECFIIVDGIQHAAHGLVEIDDYDIDAFTVSAYKVFSRHNYGIAWVSPRLSIIPHDRLQGTADNHWELGTRDTSAYACFSEVVNYLEWLGSWFTDAEESRARILAAGQAMVEQEEHLVEFMFSGEQGLRGLAAMPGLDIIGGPHVYHRAGVVSFSVDGVASADIVAHLNREGIRTHVRKNDYFSGNILEPLGLNSCVRVSVCHYNTDGEVRRFLESMNRIFA